MKLNFLTLVLALCFVTSLVAQNDILVRHPAVSPDGKTIAFSWQGDIWTVGINGGEAKRLTIHEAYESSPSWSNDGNTIAFTSQRYGNADIFTMSKTGQNVKRITYYSGGDGGATFDNSGNLYFATRRAFATVEREAELYKVNVNGGTPQRAVDATMLDPQVSPNGNMVAWVRGTCRAERETYKGPANRNVWLYNTSTKKFSPVANNDEQETMPRWAGNGNLFYLSAKTGKYNIYKTTINSDGSSGKAEAVTKEKKQGIRRYSVSADGNTIAFTQGASLYTFISGKKNKVNITMPSDYRFDPVEHKTYRSGVNEYSISPNGKLAAYVIRGEVFVSAAAKDKSKAVNISNHPYRERDVVWLNDSTLLFVSDRGGNYDVYMARSTDPNEKSLLKSYKREIVQVTNTPEDEGIYSVSPDGKNVAILRGTGTLILKSVNDDGTLGSEKTMLDGWATPGGLSWSPDGRYIAYSQSDLNFNSEIYIHPIDGGDRVNVSMHPRGDYSPTWSKDGSKLGFLSIRNGGDSDVWFAWLKKADWEKTNSDWKDDEDADKPKSKGKKGKKSKDLPKITIDFDGIHERLRQVTYMPGNEGDLVIDAKGEFFYFTTNGGSRAGYEGPSDFKKVKWNGDKMSTVMPKTGLYGISTSKDGKSMYFINRGKINKMGFGKKKPDTYSYTAKMDIHHKEEMGQIFDEAWRVIKDGFYDPNFHGRDWKKLHDQYKPIALSASTIQDFRVIFNEMLGQLDASHMGLRGFSAPENTQRESTGLLGIEVAPASNGAKITRIVPNTPADKVASKLNVGDVITAVNGEEVGNQNYYHLMEGTIGEKIMLNVTGADGAAREVLIRPTGSIRGQLYTAWVKERRALTDKYSNGKLGYLHIQGMNWSSFERFERELTAAATGKDGIVIDVRYNGGGWTTDMLMAVLNVRQHAYTVPRGAAKSLEKENKKFKNTYPYGERLPLAAWTGPAITICNQNSYSNAEIFSHAFKTLDRGTLVGMPTFGAVISTGGAGLIDGSFVRRPFRAWYVKATEENMEHGPAVPDVEVENAPDYRASGNDVQLKKAVDVLLGEMK